MLWDDLQILRALDEMEQSGGGWTTGYRLLEQFARPAGIAVHEVMGPFAKELVLARQAGYLTWTDQNVEPYSHVSDPNMWLQTVVVNVQLTLAGRDRARGRVIQVELPDPDEDDNRIITGLTMEEIARSIGDTYTAAQLPRYLRESDLPIDAVPDPVVGDKWQYVFGVLDSLHEGGSASRRALREFIGSWLEGSLHAPPPTDVRKRITSLLLQQGWHVRDGRLVIGERVRLEPGTVSPLGKDARLASLHPEIRQVTERYLDDHLNVAIFEAFKAVNNRVKQMTQLDLDGSALMDQCLGSSNPRIVFADPSTQTGRDVQQGLHFMFKGAVKGIRNLNAHEQFTVLDEEEGFEELAFASMLMRRLDTATVKGRP